MPKGITTSAPIEAKDVPSPILTKLKSQTSPVLLEIRNVLGQHTAERES